MLNGSINDSVVVMLPQRQDSLCYDLDTSSFSPFKLECLVWPHCALGRSGALSPSGILLDASFLRERLSYDMSTPILRRRQTEAEKNVNRLRNCMPDKLNTLVKMHLSFLLDLDGSKMEDILGENVDKPEPNKRKTSTPFSKKKAEKYSLFGTPLTQENLSKIFQLIEYLGKPENMRAEGLFRKTGNFARQKLLKEWLNNGTGVGLEKGMFTPHDCATVLKNFLGELPEPLLTEKHFQAHLQIVDMVKKDMTDKEKLRGKCKQIKTLQLLFMLLPRNNVMLLDCLIDLLHRLTKVSENMMTASSLGTVFAPHLLCPRKMSGEELRSYSSLVTQATSFMIECGAQIFKVPKELASDVANFWREMENPNSPLDDYENQNNTPSNLLGSHRYGSSQAINTVITFVDRKSSSDSDTATETQLALAKLYAHVQSMPDSSKKKKLLKQFEKTSAGSSAMNESAQPDSSKRKHTRSRTIGAQIRKHFSSLKHKRRGSSESTKLTSGMTWAVTPTINIDDPNDSVFEAKTPETRLKKQRPQSEVFASPVHIVDLKKSLATPVSRKRLSSESSDGSIPDKRPSPELLPSTENEIKYLSKTPLERKICQCTPESRGNKPIALVSPITQSPISKSIDKASQEVQKNAMTPRSRAPLVVIQSPNGSRETNI